MPSLRPTPRRARPARDRSAVALVAVAPAPAGAVAAAVALTALAVAVSVFAATCAAPAWADEPSDSASAAEPKPAPSGFDLGERVKRNGGLPEDEDELLEPVEVAPSRFLLTAPAEAAFVRSLRLEGYLDVGFFFTTGDGAGHTAGRAFFPSLADRSWVFAGDPLATAVNSRGEPADTGGSSNRSRALDRDVVDSEGEPAFLVNEINLDLLASLTPELVGFFSVDILPRKFGDTGTDLLTLDGLVDIDRAFLEWTVSATREATVSLALGRFDGVVGREYRYQDSPDRFGVTPSLMFRYLGGHPFGVKLRGSFFRDRFTLAAAVTDRTGFIDLFELGEDSPRYPRVGSLRAAFKWPLLGGFELGVSGLLGAQDGQDDDGVLQWQLGADIALAVWRIEIAIEYQRGHAVGADEPDAAPCARAECLEFESAYGEIVYRTTPWLGFLFRVDWRDALHEYGNDFVYVSNVMRYTFGIRLPILDLAIVKLEYLHVAELDDELGPIPDFADDVFTSSLIVEF